MQMRWIGMVLLVSFIAVAAFGLYIPMIGHAAHGAMCPFSLGVAALCAPDTHVKHWQGAMMAVIETLVFVMLALIFFAFYQLFDPDVRRYALSRVRSRVSHRPTLMQELFSRGILNRKEPSFSFA